MPSKAPQDLAPRYNELRGIIKECARDPAAPPEILAVSKGQSADRIRALYSLGQRRFGENYAQELLAKAAQLSDLPIEWVYIGHLQSNKIRKLAAVTDEIQTLARWSDATALARAVSALNRAPFKVFLEVKVDPTDSKAGLDMSEAFELSERIKAELPELRVRGLMAIPSSEYQDAAMQEVPPLYRELRALADRIGEGQLSLGMSGDLRLAAAAGSTVVRLGQALLGPRSAPPSA